MVDDAVQKRIEDAAIFLDTPYILANMYAFKPGAIAEVKITDLRVSSFRSIKFANVQVKYG